MSILCAHVLSICTCMTFVCQLYVLVLCHLYVTRMYSYIVRMSLVCTCMSSVCHSYVLIGHLYITRMYSDIIRLSLLCTRILSVCHSYIPICHPHVTRTYSYVICVSVCYSYVLECHPYVTRMYLYFIRMSLVCGFNMNPLLNKEILQIFNNICERLLLSFLGFTKLDHDVILWLPWRHRFLYN